MTVTLTDQDTDTARQILEQLNDERPCEFSGEGCSKTAAFIVVGHTTFCGCRIDFATCSPCTDEMKARLADSRLWECDRCATRSLGLGSDLFVIDRIEPI